MRTCKGAHLLAVALVVVLLSSGIFPAMAASVFAPINTCVKIISSGRCNPKTCYQDCFSQTRGNGRCVRTGCQCQFKCKPAPPPADI
ncbi:hypothetical protein ACP70R_026106 [Stipagrostis hirtigluma subsp. patula]